MVIRRIDMAMAIQVTDTDIIRTDTTDPIGPMAITTAHHTTVGTATIVIIGTIITTATKLA